MTDDDVLPDADEREDAVATAAAAAEREEVEEEQIGGERLDVVRGWRSVFFGGGGDGQNARVAEEEGQEGGQRGRARRAPGRGQSGRTAGRQRW